MRPETETEIEMGPARAGAAAPASRHGPSHGGRSGLGWKSGSGPGRLWQRSGLTPRVALGVPPCTARGRAPPRAQCQLRTGPLVANKWFGPGDLSFLNVLGPFFFFF